MARIVAFNVGAATSNSTTSSENDIQTLPLGIFTLPLSLIVIIARFIPTILQIFHKLYSQTLIYRVRVWCLLPLRKSALWLYSYVLDSCSHSLSSFHSSRSYLKMYDGTCAS